MSTLRQLCAPGAALLLALCGCSEGPAELHAAPSDSTNVAPRSSPGSPTPRRRPFRETEELGPQGRPKAHALAEPPPTPLEPPSFVQVAPRTTKPVLPAPYRVPSDELHAQLSPFIAKHGLEVEGAVQLHEPAVERLRALPESELPDVVRAKLDDIRRGFVERSRGKHYARQELLWMDELLRIEIPQPGAAALHAYVSHEPEWSSMPHDEVYCLFLHDPATDEITATPVRFSGQWLYPEGPRPSWTDLEGDGRPEFVYRDFQHNGTVVNRDERVYLSIGDDLSLREVFRHVRHNQETLVDHEWVEIFARPLRVRDGDELCLLAERWSVGLDEPHVERTRPPHLYRRANESALWRPVEPYSQD